mgnify:CR=1 FL=1
MREGYEDWCTRLLSVSILKIRDLREIRQEWNLRMTDGELRPGHVEEGKFTVVCTGGEFELAFTAIIEKPYVMTTYGKVQSTDDFRKLAIKDFQKREGSSVPKNSMRF